MTGKCVLHFDAVINLVAKSSGMQLWILKRKQLYLVVRIACKTMHGSGMLFGQPIYPQPETRLIHYFAIRIYNSATQSMTPNQTFFLQLIVELICAPT